jgi:hypothetical protein
MLSTKLRQSISSNAVKQLAAKRTSNMLHLFSRQSVMKNQCSYTQAMIIKTRSVMNSSVRPFSSDLSDIDALLEDAETDNNKIDTSEMVQLRNKSKEIIKKEKEIEKDNKEPEMLSVNMFKPSTQELTNE